MILSKRHNPKRGDTGTNNKKKTKMSYLERFSGIVRNTGGPVVGNIAGGGREIRREAPSIVSNLKASVSSPKRVVLMEALNLLRALGFAKD